MAIAQALTTDYAALAAQADAARKAATKDQMGSLQKTLSSPASSKNILSTIGAGISQAVANDAAGIPSTGSKAELTDEEVKKNAKNNIYTMQEEARYSASQIGNYKDFYSRMRNGRVAPAASLLSPYRGYGGPRSTMVGNANVQTATKTLLGA